MSLSQICMCFFWPAEGALTSTPKFCNWILETEVAIFCSKEWSFQGNYDVQYIIRKDDNLEHSVDELLTDDGNCFTEELKTNKKEKNYTKHLIIIPGLKASTGTPSSEPSSEYSSARSRDELLQEPTLWALLSTGVVGLSAPPRSFLWILEWRTNWWYVRKILPHSSQFVGLSLRIRPFCSGDGEGVSLGLSSLCRPCLGLSPPQKPKWPLVPLFQNQSPHCQSWSRIELLGQVRTYCDLAPGGQLPSLVGVERIKLGYPAAR